MEKCVSNVKHIPCVDKLQKMQRHDFLFDFLHLNRYLRSSNVQKCVILQMMCLIKMYDTLCILNLKRIFIDYVYFRNVSLVFLFVKHSNALNVANDN